MKMQAFFRILLVNCSRILLRRIRQFRPGTRWSTSALFHSRPPVSLQRRACCCTRPVPCADRQFGRGRDRAEGWRCSRRGWRPGYARLEVAAGVRRGDGARPSFRYFKALIILLKMSFNGPSG